MADVEWEQITFWGPIDAHKYSGDEINEPGSPFLCLSFGDDDKTPSVAFHTTDEPDADDYWKYRRPLKEILEDEIDGHRNGRGVICEDEDYELRPQLKLAQMLLATIEEWRAKYQCRTS